MQNFKKWLENSHPEFSEGLLQSLHPTANKVVGGSNAAIGLMGVLGRLYTPFIGASGLAAAEIPPLPERPAMVAPANPGETWKKKGISLTGNKTIDDIGNSVGDPTNQGWWDAGDWIPGEEMQKRQDGEEEFLKAGADQIAVAMGPKDPTALRKLTPKIRAQIRARVRRANNGR